MFIRLPFNDFVDRLVLDSELFSKLSECCVSFGIKLAYSSHFLMREQSVESIGTSRVGLLPVFGPHVIDVVLVSANKQMFWAKAKRSVAMVKDQFRRLQFSMNSLISHSMDKFWAKREHPRNNQSTVPAIVLSAIPEHTFFRVRWPWLRQSVQEIRIAVTLYKAHVRSLLRIILRGPDDVCALQGLPHYTCVFSGWQA